MCEKSIFDFKVQINEEEEKHAANNQQHNDDDENMCVFLFQ